MSDATPPPSLLPDPSARNMGMLCHLLAFSGFIVPFGNILGPLVIWLMKKDQLPFVDSQGKESLNFQISMTIYIAIAAVLTYVCIGLPFLIALPIVDIVLVILASIKASEGVAYRYPLTIRLIN